MHIWVDADACPLVIKEILYRAAERLEIPLTLVANKLLRTPRSPLIRALFAASVTTVIAAAAHAPTTSDAADGAARVRRSADAATVAQAWRLADRQRAHPPHSPTGG